MDIKNNCIFRLRCGSLSSSSNMHHHDHTWHRTAEAGENSSTATASDLQQHLDQGLLSSSSSRSRQRSSPGSNSLSFPVSPYQLPCVFSKQLLYMPIRILETLAREIGDRTVSVRSIHNDRKDNLVFFSTLLPLSYFLVPFSELLLVVTSHTTQKPSKK